MSDQIAAVILAGGRSSRLGRTKEDVVVGGRTLLDRTLAACGDASTLVVVGPPRDDLPESVIQVREQPPHGGPVAAVAAALPYISEDSVLVLACDMPWVGEAVETLRSPRPGTDAVIARDRGHIQPLVGHFRRSSLDAVLARLIVDGASMRSVLADLVIEPVDVRSGSLEDIDDAAGLSRAIEAEKSLNSDDALLVRDAMIVDPKVFADDVTVADLRAFFDNDHVQLAILTNVDRRVITVVAREDIVVATDDALPARTIGTLHDRWVRSEEALEPIRDRMLRHRIRRLVVVDADRRLVGLLCMKRRFHGFCSAADVEARELDRT